MSGAFGLLSQGLGKSSEAVTLETPPKAAIQERSDPPASPAPETNKEVSKQASTKQKPKVKAVESAEEIVQLDTSRIVSWLYKDRQEVDLHTDQFQKLIESIMQEGQHQPILVRPIKHKDYDYEEVYGYRRLHACRALGIKVKAIIREVDDRKAFVAQITENDDRTNPSYWARALSFKKAADNSLFPTLESFAVQCRIARPTISNYIRVGTNMPDIFQERLRLHDFSRDALFFLLSIRHEIGYFEEWLDLKEDWQYDSPAELKEIEKSWSKFIAKKESGISESDNEKKEVPEKLSGSKVYTGKAGKLFSINRRGETVTINILKDGKRILSDSEIADALLKIMEEKASQE